MKKSMSTKLHNYYVTFLILRKGANVFALLILDHGPLESTKFMAISMTSHLLWDLTPLLIQVWGNFLAYYFDWKNNSYIIRHLHMYLTYSCISQKTNLWNMFLLLQNKWIYLLQNECKFSNRVFYLHWLTPTSKNVGQKGTNFSKNIYAFNFLNDYFFTIFL